MHTITQSKEEEIKIADNGLICLFQDEIQLNGDKKFHCISIERQSIPDLIRILNEIGGEECG